MTETDVVTRRDRLIESALALLSDRGPAALTTRALAEHAGLTTMAVYSEFGSMGGVTKVVVDAGFARLAKAFAALPTTDDPIFDLMMLGATYRRCALTEPHLYSVMFGTTTIGGYRRTGDELVWGIETFREGEAIVARAMADGRLRIGDTFQVTAQLWSALHGALILETANMLDVAGDPLIDVTLPMFTALIVGLGDSGDRVIAATAKLLAHLDLDAHEPPAAPTAKDTRERARTRSSSRLPLNREHRAAGAD